MGEMKNRINTLFDVLDLLVIRLTLFLLLALGAYSLLTGHYL
jgi:hypothetical protein